MPKSAKSALKKKPGSLALDIFSGGMLMSLSQLRTRMLTTEALCEACVWGPPAGKTFHLVPLHVNAGR